MVLDQRTPVPTRRRRLGWLIAIPLGAAIIIGGLVVGDAIARQYATDLVRVRIIEALKLDKNADVTVDLGTEPFLLQAIAGSLNTVTVNVAELSFGEITAAATMTAVGLPIDMTQPVEKLAISVTITEDQVQKLRSVLSGIDLTSIKLGDGVISVATEFNVFGLLQLPVAVDLVPGAINGAISFEAQTILLDGNEISVADLRANPLVSALAGQLLASQTFCIAEFLHESFAIADVAVEKNQLVITITGDGAVLAEPEISIMGVCP
jgi:hypothetical protein